MEKGIKKFISSIKNDKACLNDIIKRYEDCSDEDLNILNDCIDLMMIYNKLKKEGKI